MCLTMAVDYYDLVWSQDELFDEEHINRLLGEYSQRGVDAVLWRVSVCGKLFYHSATGDRFTATPFSADNIPGFAAIHRPLYNKCTAIMAKMDPMEVAMRLCRKHGIKIYPWLTIYDDAGYHPFTWSELICRHPEYCWKSIDSEVYYHGVTSYVYPEVVEYRLRQINELLNYGVDGIHLCNRSHSRPPGYIEQYLEYLRTHTDAEWKDTPTGRNRKAMINACRGRFGFDPPAVKAFRQKFGRDPLSADPDWWSFRGEYLSDFLRKAKALASSRAAILSLAVRDEINMFPSDFFNWRGMLKEGIVDILHYAATDKYRGVAAAKNETPELFECAGRKNYFVGVNHVNTLEKHIKHFEDSGNAQFMDCFEGITAFEAFHLLLRPELWSFIDYLRKTFKTGEQHVNEG